VGSEGYVFEEFPWASAEPDACHDRLCKSPARDVLGDVIRINCALEGASFIKEPLPPKDELVILAYNLERGLKVDEQLEAVLGDGGIPMPDIALLSESDRGCGRTDCRNISREWAEALGMNYVYGVEFIELPRLWGPAGGRMLKRCEHGNSILSRYPLGNVRLVRHAKNRSWHSWWQRIFLIGEPRLGGRMALTADVKVGERYIHLYSVHFESREGNKYRPAQAAELADMGLTQPHPVIIGGDMNCTPYKADLENGTTLDFVTQALLQRGYEDSHVGIPAADRITTRSNNIIDLVFGRRVKFVEAGIGGKAIWDRLSDHLPVWTRIGLV
jgi:endonuclease/exonuclease/phosphatase family metal-dependent hydrolase